MADFDPRCEAWPDFTADEIVRRVRCLADDEPDEGDSPAQIWRHACDTILLRMGKHPAQADTPPPSGDVPKGSSGEIEGLVDALIDAVRNQAVYEGRVWGMRASPEMRALVTFAEQITAARTALLSRITSPSSGGGLTQKRPVPPAVSGIYTASKTRHADRWKALRAEGWPIASTWIDEAGKGETACFTDLWRRCIWEASQADALLLYCEPGDVLKGALVEVGAALGQGVPVYAVGCREFTFAKAAGWVDCASIEDALERIQTQLTTPLTITIAPGETTAFVQSVTDGIPAMQKALLTPPDLIQAAREVAADKLVGLINEYAEAIRMHERTQLLNSTDAAARWAEKWHQTATAIQSILRALQTTPQGEEGLAPLPPSE